MIHSYPLSLGGFLLTLLSLKDVPTQSSFGLFIYIPYLSSCPHILYPLSSIISQYLFISSYRYHRSSPPPFLSQMTYALFLSTHTTRTALKAMYPPLSPFHLSSSHRAIRTMVKSLTPGNIEDVPAKFQDKKRDMAIPESGALYLSR